MRALAYIETIKSLSPIPGADKIEKAEVLGWELVVKVGDFRVGDRCIYIEIDSILPELPVFEFLRPRKFRVRTIRLKSQCSQGIAFPLSIITQVDPSFDISKVKVGQDMTDVLRITKYDPEAVLPELPLQPKKSWLANKWSFIKWKFFGGARPVRANSFPAGVPKTDEIRVQKMGSELSKRAGELAYISEKLEGSSATFVYRGANNSWLNKLFNRDYLFQVCSRNRVVWDNQSGGEADHYLVKLQEKYHIQSGMQQLNRNLAIQGESLGGKIQGNIYKLPEHDFRVFLVYDLDAKKYLPFTEAVDITGKLGLDFVPVLGVEIPIVSDVKHYVELSKGYSKLNPKVLREGVVIRTMSGDFSFKSINPDYLLASKD